MTHGRHRQPQFGGGHLVRSTPCPPPSTRRGKARLGPLADQFPLEFGQTVNDKQDDKGYLLMSYTFSIGGTPAKPDSSQLWKIIGEAAARSFLR